jgi:hypothetical protein
MNTTEPIAALTPDGECPKCRSSNPKGAAACTCGQTLAIAAAARRRGVANGGLRTGAVGAVAVLCLGFLFLFVVGVRDPNAYARALGSLTTQTFLGGLIVGYIRQPRSRLWLVLAIIAGLVVGGATTGSISRLVERL